MMVLSTQTTQNCKGLQMIDPVKAGTIEANAADCGSYAPFRYPDRSRRQTSCVLEVFATRND